MSDITCIYHLTVEPANFQNFKDLVTTIVEKATSEAGTFIYEYSASKDEREVHIVERYRPDQVLSHVELTFAPYAARFMELANIEKLFVYGEIPADIRAKLDGFGALYMSPMVGFSKPFSVA